MDFGCSYHMSPYRGWFSNFEEFDGRIVLMGNNNTCQTKRMRNIILKLFDGTISVLTDVRYVLYLKKISSHWES